jgi:hypothetical protein
MKNLNFPSKYRFLLICFFAILTVSLSFAQSDEPVEPSEVEGVIQARSGQIVAIDCPSGELPAVGVQSNMSKHFEEKWGKSVMSGWLGTALVETVSVEAKPGGRILLKVRIVEEKSSITVNDEKVDHFKKGKRVKLVWPVED